MKLGTLKVPIVSLRQNNMEYLFFLIPLILILLIFLITLLLYFKVFFNEKKGSPKEFEPLKGKLYTVFKQRSLDLIKSSNAVPWENKQIKINNHLILKARYYHVSDNAPLAIMVHGYKGVGIRDFSGGLIELLNRKANVLLIDHRGHGRSSGRTITFGVKEKYDVLKWIEFANKEFNTPDIYLYGISMGAATVLMVSGMEQLPSNVKCVVADCPYSSVKQIISDTIRKMHLPVFLIYPFIYLSAIIFAHFNINKGVVFDYIKNTRIPIMIIHGTTDDIVPVIHSRKLKNSFEDKIHYVEIQGAPHGMSYFVDYDRYSKELTEFLHTVK